MLDKVIIMSLCASVALAIDSNGICAENGLLLPHENCNQFYSCVGSTPEVLTCPVGLLFNSLLQSCDWPENVDCSNRDIIDTNSTTTTQNFEIDNGTATATCAAEGSDGILVPHENCSLFYKCSEGKPVALSCPLNLLYNPKTEQCDWPENVNCSNRDISDVTPSQTDEIPSNSSTSAPAVENSGNEIAITTCATEGSDGILVLHENCNQFYKCSNGKPVAQSCPSNLLYNPDTEQCDWPENVDCTSSRNTLKVLSITSRDTAQVCAAEGSDGILLPHENCNQFYKCSNGIPVAQSCPSSLLYNPDTEQCDWPENVDCSRNRLKVLSITSRDTAQICAAEGSDGILIPHENCNQFYKCSNGIPVAQSCPSSLLYNPDTEQCDWPENVDCGNRA